MTPRTDVVVVLRDPTQFDAPFFRWVAGQGGALKVVYIRGDRFGSGFFDAELNRSVSWQQDLASGYPNRVLPMQKRARALIREVARSRHGLVVVAGYRHPLFLLAAVSARLRRSLVALRLDTVSFGTNGKHRQLSRRLLYMALKRLFHKFLAVGESTQSFLETMGVPSARIGRFAYSVDVEEFARRSSLTAGQRRQVRRRCGVAIDRTVVLSITKFNEREAPWDLLRAASTLAAGDMQLWLVGDGPLRTALEQYAAAVGCDAVFSGYRPFSDLPEIYAAADIFVHPARFEPWGVSVQEAAACGLPVIASSHVGSAYDLITEGTNGYVYEAGNYSDLRSKLARLGRQVDVNAVREEHGRRLRPFQYDAMWASLQAAAVER